MIIKRTISVVNSQSQTPGATPILDNREQSAPEHRITQYTESMSMYLSIDAGQDKTFDSSNPNTAMSICGFFLQVDQEVELTLDGGTPITVPVSTHSPGPVGQWCVDGKFQSIKIKNTGTGSAKLTGFLNVWGNTAT